MQCKEIEKRSSTRFFKPDKVLPENVIHSILEAASLAPSGHNLQPWRFRVITDKEMIGQLADGMENNGWIRYASCIIAVGKDTKVSYDIEKDSMAVGAAIENMLIEAKANEVDSCWVAGGIDGLAVDMLHIDSSIKLMSLIAFGYSRMLGSTTQKKGIEELLM